mgnify:CR=1 FL=1
METMDLRQGDCLTLMKSIPDKSVDLMICDLPYGETNCKWDTCINLEEFWKEFKRIRKSKRTLCIHFCSTKFGYTLIKSWESGFKMDMVWKKRNKTGGLQSRYRPMRNHEMVYFFYEQTPKYNRDKYHKRIAQKTHDIKKECVYGNTSKMGPINNFEPPNPASVIEDAESNKLWGYNKPDTFSISKNGTNQAFDPPNPVSVLEEEEKNYMGKTKQQVLNSRSENGKNHKHTFEPPNPGSVIEDTTCYGIDKKVAEKSGNPIGVIGAGYEPKLPTSVIEEKDSFGWDKSVVKEMGNKIGKVGPNFYPPNPGSVIEETTTNGITKEKCLKSRKSKFAENGYEPPNPSSVIEEKPKKVYHYEKGECCYGTEAVDNHSNIGKPQFEPPNPSSVLEEESCYGKANGGKGFSSAQYKEKFGHCPLGYEPPNPGSVFDSQKVFIGKRNHQTEKPQDILEFFLKYWSDEGETILDPTMGSGSTGVACKKMGRKFIGFELDEKIFKKAQDRINVD